MDTEEILKSYIKGTASGEDNKLRATIGKLTADRNKDLADSIKGLNQQMAVTILNLQHTISENADKMIISNERLSKTNEKYAKWMKWLTFGLVLVSFLQYLRK